MAKSEKKRKNVKLAPRLRDLDVPKLPPLDDPNGLLLQVQTDFRGNELTLYRLFGHIAHIWLTYQRDLAGVQGFPEKSILDVGGTAKERQAEARE